MQASNASCDILNDIIAGQQALLSRSDAVSGRDLARMERVARFAAEAAVGGEKQRRKRKKRSSSR